MPPRYPAPHLRLVSAPDASLQEEPHLSSNGTAGDVATAGLPLTPEPPLATTSRRGASVRPPGVASSELSDGELVALGIDGDRGALETLYRRHAAFAIHLATRIEGSTRDVEDVAHDAFLRAFERLHTLTDRNAFKGWLGAIIVHRVRSRMRRTRLMTVLGLNRGVDAIDLDSLASQDASPHVRAQLAQIYALLRTLPTDDRIAWTLRSVEGHDLETVARLTDCSLATVKRRISRAQKFLDGHFVHTGAVPEAAVSEAAVSDAAVSDAIDAAQQSPAAAVLRKVK